MEIRSQKTETTIAPDREQSSRQNGLTPGRSSASEADLDCIQSVESHLVGTERRPERLTIIWVEREIPVLEQRGTPRLRAVRERWRPERPRPLLLAGGRR